MLEYWMGSNESALNASEYEIQEVIQNPGLAVLFQDYPPWSLKFAASCCTLFMIIGIPGNLITVVALFRTRKYLSNATTVFIMNLSFSDLLFCCFNLPLSASTFWFGSWVYGSTLCRLFPLLRYGLVAVSLFTVLAITINRYIMIGHPRLYPILYKPRNLMMMVAATWIGGFGALIPTWFGMWGRFGLDTVIGSCSILPDANGNSPKQFLFVIAFVAPCISISICYARIFYIARMTAIRSRRRDEATRELVHSNFEAKCSKITEDSAIGSISCPATHTTLSENGGSPFKCDHHGLVVPRSPSLRRLSLPKFLRRASGLDADEDEESARKQRRRSSNVSDREEQRVIPEVRVHENHHRADEEAATEFAKSLEQLPYIDVNNGGGGGNGADQILDSQSLQKANNSSSRFLSPPATFKYEEVSDDGASSRSDSPSERRRASASSRGRGDVTPTSGSSRVLRRESRLRSVRSGGGRASEPAGKMTTKDKKLLKMILVIFSSFLICYLPITLTKTFKSVIDWPALNIASYILIYLTTCINPVIYVVMSSEYRSAYKNMLLCRSDSAAKEKQRKARKVSCKKAGKANG